MPTFSVVIPSFNYGRYIAQAIESALDQTHKATQVIVIDDGSTDNSLDVIARYADHVEIVQHARRGVAAARNEGIRRAVGDFIAFLDSDDFWEPTKLEVVSHAITLHPRVTVFGSGAFTVDSDGRVGAERRPASTTTYGRASVDEILLFRSRTAASAAVVKTDTARRTGGFDCTLSYAEDWEAWMRFAAEGGFHVLEQPLIYYREHLGGMFRNPERLRGGMSAALEKVLAWHKPGPLTARHARAIVWEHYGYELEIAQDHLAAQRAFRRAALLWPIDIRLLLKGLRRSKSSPTGYRSERESR